METFIFTFTLAKYTYTNLSTRDPYIFTPSVSYFKMDCSKSLVFLTEVLTSMNQYICNISCLKLNLTFLIIQLLSKH